MNNREDVENVKLMFLIFYACKHEKNKEITKQLNKMKGIEQIKSLDILKKVEAGVYEYVTKEHDVLMTLLSYFHNLNTSSGHKESKRRQAVINKHYNHKNLDNFKLLLYELYLQKSLISQA